MSNITKDSIVQIKQSYFDVGLRGRKGKVISAPTSNAFLGDVTLVGLFSGGQVSIASQYLELVPEPKTEFKEGYRVQFKETTPNRMYRGKKATATSNVYTSKRNWETDTDLIDLKLDDGSTLKGAHIVNLDIIEKILTEGEEIDPKDITVGMVVKVTYTSKSGDYEQVSSKQGKVVRVENVGGKVYPYVQGASNDIQLSFGTNNEQFYTLIKNAPKIDPVKEALKAAKAGSVVQIEDGGIGKFILTYVKVDNDMSGLGRWMHVDSRYTNASLISETTVRSKMQSLEQLVITK